jgi:hypothetical protein
MEKMLNSFLSQSTRTYSLRQNSFEFCLSFFASLMVKKFFKWIDWLPSNKVKKIISQPLKTTWVAKKKEGIEMEIAEIRNLLESMEQKITSFRRSL